MVMYDNSSLQLPAGMGGSLDGLKIPIIAGFPLQCQTSHRKLVRALAGSGAPHSAVPEMACPVLTTPDRLFCVLTVAAFTRIQMRPTIRAYFEVHGKASFFEIHNRLAICQAHTQVRRAYQG